MALSQLCWNGADSYSQNQFQYMTALSCIKVDSNAWAANLCTKQGPQQTYSEAF